MSLKIEKKRFNTKSIEKVKSKELSRKSPLYWLNKIHKRGGLSYAIENPSEWQCEIRSWDKVLVGREAE